MHAVTRDMHAARLQYHAFVICEAVAPHCHATLHLNGSAQYVRHATLYVNFVWHHIADHAMPKISRARVITMSRAPISADACIVK